MRITTGKTPARRAIGHERPLFYFSVHGQGDAEREAFVDQAWERCPPAVRSCCSFLAPYSRELLAHARRREIPLIVHADVEGQVDPDMFQECSNLLGVCGPEYPERFGWPAVPRAAERVAKYGGLVLWQFLFNFGRIFDRDPEIYGAYRKHREQIVLEIKANGFPEWWSQAEDGRERFGRFVHYAEVMLGAWLTGLAGNWGFHPEVWQWFELGHYTHLFDYSLPGTRFRHELPDPGMYNTTFHNIGFCGYPENLMAQEVLNAAIYGCAVFSFEHGFEGGVLREDSPFGPIDDYTVLPLLDEIARRKLIPSQEEMMGRVRAASWTGEPIGPRLNRPGAFWPNSFRRLYATTSVFMQNDGRYGLIPCLPRYTPPQERKKFECFPTGYHYRYLPFLNALYPEEGRGQCFIERHGRCWYVFNPYENVDKMADFELPLYKNTCHSLSGRLGTHCLAIVEEWPERIEVYLSNFRLTKDEFWDRRHEIWMGDEFADIDGRLSGTISAVRPRDEAAKMGRKVRRHIQSKINTRPPMADARRTTLVLEGHAGIEAPALEIGGHEGFRYQQRWDPARQRYELDVDHNGVVRLVLRASGHDQDKKPPEALSRNLALDRPAKASSAKEGCEAALAVDGLHETCWRPGGDGPQWLAVDLGQEVPVSAYKVVGAAGEGGALALQFQAGPSAGGPWTTAHEGKLDGTFFRVFPVDGWRLEEGQRWVRLLVQPPGEGFLLREFGVYRGPNAELKEWMPLVEPQSLGELIALLGKATSDAERAAVEEAAWDFCSQGDMPACVEELVRALPGSEELAAASLVRLLGRLGSAPALTAVRRAAAESAIRRPEVREAAQWALAQWPDGAELALSALDDVLHIARTARDLSLHAQALRWLLRCDQRWAREQLPIERRERILAEGIALATEGRDRLAYVEAARTAACPNVLEAVLTCLDDPIAASWLLQPARATCLEIAERIWRSHPGLVRRALARILDGPRDGGYTQASERARALFARLAQGCKTPPPAIAGLVVEAVSPHCARISWPAFSTLPEPGQWSSSPDGIAGYRLYWQADGQESRFTIEGATTATWIVDDVLDGSTCSCQIAALSFAGLEGPRSKPVLLRLPDDREPPRIDQVYGLTAVGEVRVRFDKAVSLATDPRLAEELANYGLDGGARILSLSTGAEVVGCAHPRSTGQWVQLKVAGLQDGKCYTLSVANVRDRARTPNTMAAASVCFTAEPYARGIHWAAYRPSTSLWAESLRGKILRCPFAQGVDEAIGLPKALRPQIGSGLWVRFDGMLRVPQDGEYLFSLRSDGKGALHIVGQGSLESKSGKDGWARMRLAAGFHPLVLMYQVGPLGRMGVQWLAVDPDRDARLDLESQVAADETPFDQVIGGMRALPADALWHLPGDG